MHICVFAAYKTGLRSSLNSGNSKHEFESENITMCIAVPKSRQTPQHTIPHIILHNQSLFSTRSNYMYTIQGHISRGISELVVRV